MSPTDWRHVIEAGVAEENQRKMSQTLNGAGDGSPKRLTSANFNPNTHRQFSPYSTSNFEEIGHDTQSRKNAYFDQDVNK